jgi:hypothetical protein
MGLHRRTVIAFIAAALIAGPTAAFAVTSTAGSTAPAKAAGAAHTEPGHGTTPTDPAACDPLDPTQCLLPYPSDWWTRPAATVTGRRVDFTMLAMPRNAAGKPLNPIEFNRLDGFSPGATIITHINGVDTPAAYARNHLVSVTTMGSYSQSTQPVVVIDASTHQRWPVWAELDANAGSPDKSNLFVHPAMNFRENTRYIVAFRHLVTAAGTALQPAPAFRAYRDKLAPASDPRRAHMEEVFNDLKAAGIGRTDLNLAWDFTVASRQSLTGRMLSMRDSAFADLGDTNLADQKVSGVAPKFSVVDVANYTAAEDSKIARTVTVDVTVPCFIWPSCSAPNEASATVPPPAGSELPVDSVPANAGSGKFVLSDVQDPYAVPRRNPEPIQARVVCNIPRQALDGAHPVSVRPSLYGHGLFGLGSEVNGGNVKDMASRHGYLFCAPNWVGMSTGDVPNALLGLVDLSEFPLIGDRMQQGILDFLIVGRAMIHQNGFGSDPAFQVNGKSVIDRTKLYYDGNSQGGIYGGTVCALEPDADRCVLGVPAIAYSVLLYRSSDFVAKDNSVPDVQNGDLPAYATPFEASYRDPAARPLLLALTQMLWDRSDPNGYAAHMTTTPLPNTPQHRVLMQVAFGDHQVTTVQADAEARTIGAGVLWPALESATRSPDVVPYWGIPRITSFPYDGSAMTIFDTGPVRTVNGEVAGTNAPPTTNTPNFAGKDPHGGPRSTLCGQQQKADFLAPNGRVTAPCTGAPYFAYGYHDAQS